jgi:UDP-N-acetylmuramoyl-tripeptide--D-alanyl-D-alanine ligase
MLLDMDDADNSVVHWDMDGCHVSLRRGDECVAFDLSLPAYHWAEDAALAATILGQLGFASLQEVAAAMGSWQAVGGRMHSLMGLGGSHLLDDSYNANPASMAVALDTLRHMTGRRIAVLGDMAELGRDSAALHAGLDISGLDVVLLVGVQMRALAALHSKARHMTDVDQALAALLEMNLGKGDTLLIKGSRSMHMERVVAGLRDGRHAV